MNNEKYFFENLPKIFPPQHQEPPGLEYLMQPLPIFDNPYYIGSGKLQNKIAIITGGDSGIGRAVAYAFAKEGADIVISYYNEYVDANNTKSYIESLGKECLLIEGDIKDINICKQIIAETVTKFGRIDILVNNAGIVNVEENIEKISDQEMQDIFNTNVYSNFRLIKEAIPFMSNGSTIICTASSTVYSPTPLLIDYISTKSAVVGLVRSLALSLISKGIRVNGVAPGSTWTPLIISNLKGNEVTNFGSESPIKRAAQPFEIAPAYVFLASNDSSYVVGQIIHVDGGTTIS